jgi:hypothetical protein
MASLSAQHITPFLNQRRHKASQWFSYFGLGIGILLLLCAIQMYININRLIKDKSNRNTGYEYISVSKIITNENMGQDNRFTPADVQRLQQQPFLEAAAPLIANQFRIKASAGNIIPFSTDLFIESINNQFLDTIPPGFTWKEGQTDIPVIFSSDFLEMYNVFAPGQDLPQLSEQTISAVSIIMECYTPNGIQSYKARIVALSDRISSVLVPESFMQYANKNFGGIPTPNAGRVYIKTRDANSPELLQYLAANQYRVNKDRTWLGRSKQLFQAILGGLAGFGLLVVVLALVLFSFYLQLMIARSKDNLTLLLTLGYSPAWISRTVVKKWIPVYATIILIALGVTAVLQYGFKWSMPDRDGLSAMLHGVVVLVALLLLSLTVWINYRLVKKMVSGL